MTQRTTKISFRVKTMSTRISSYTQHVCVVERENTKEVLRWCDIKCQSRMNRTEVQQAISAGRQVDSYMMGCPTTRFCPETSTTLQCNH